uniref:Uncharacterized protein n=1 Tax=Nelumbo nucifera TaxID=4432 RepID=A0A822YAC6_NELNU|nr:TPA_asm: hypothetical protein HUJ06_029969 [Nelumbo nucifera]
MGFVVVISLPVILFILILAIACYLLGRARGQTLARPAPPQYYGPPPVLPVPPQAHDHEKPQA